LGSDEAEKNAERLHHLDEKAASAKLQADCETPMNSRIS
jgi:hypothetical protein